MGYKWIFLLNHPLSRSFKKEQQLLNFISISTVDFFPGVGLSHCSLQCSITQNNDITTYTLSLPVSDANCDYSWTTENGSLKVSLFSLWRVIFERYEIVSFVTTRNTLLKLTATTNNDSVVIAIIIMIIIIIDFNLLSFIVIACHEYKGTKCTLHPSGSA